MIVNQSGDSGLPYFRCTIDVNKVQYIYKQQCNHIIITEDYKRHRGLATGNLYLQLYYVYVCLMISAFSFCCCLVGELTLIYCLCFVTFCYAHTDVAMYRIGYFRRSIQAISAITMATPIAYIKIFTCANKSCVLKNIQQVATVFICLGEILLQLLFLM